MSRLLLRRLSRVGAAVVLAALAALPGRAQTPAGGEMIPREDGPKTYLFRSLLKFAGVEPIDRLPGLAERSEVVLVLFGRIDEQDAGPKSRDVLDAGGAVLIATDQMTNLWSFVPRPVGLGVSGRQVVAAARGDGFGGHLDMPFLKPPGPSYRNQDLQRMTAMSRVATNRPSSFIQLFDGGDLNTPLARFPDGSRHETHPRPLGTPYAALMNNPEIGTKSVATVYTDPGIFTNQMLLAKDTDNFAYAFYLTRYLTTSPTGDRKRTLCLFIENGIVKTDFNAVPLVSSGQLPPVPPVPVPSLEQMQDKITDAANAALDDLQTRDALGRAVAENYPRLVGVLVLAAAVAAAVYLLLRAWEARHHPEFTTPPRALADPDRSPLDRRRQEVLRTNDVYEPLREHLRGLFARWGRADGGPELPPLEIAGGRADRKLLEDRVRKLWEIAFGGVPAVIPFVRWKELEPMIEFVSRAADAGRWRFARPGGVA